jgi:hypothetical protein
MVDPLFKFFSLTFVTQPLEIMESSSFSIISRCVSPMDRLFLIITVYSVTPQHLHAQSDMDSMISIRSNFSDQGLT